MLVKAKYFFPQLIKSRSYFQSLVKLLSFLSLFIVERFPDCHSICFDNSIPRKIGFGYMSLKLD